MTTGVSLPLPRAAMIAVTLEAVIALVLVYGLASRNDPAPPPPVTQITLAPPPDVPTPVMSPPPPVPTPAPAPVRHQATPQPVTQPVPQPTPPSAEPAPDVVPPVVPQTTTQPVQTEAAVPAKPVPSTIFPASFGDKVRAAVQAAVVFPMAARASHLSGQTQVGFTYLDGEVSDAKVVTSSGNALLDKAALAAVHAPHYPPPPAEYQGKSLAFEIWVRFLRLEEQEE